MSATAAWRGRGTTDGRTLAVPSAGGEWWILSSVSAGLAGRLAVPVGFVRGLLFAGSLVQPAVIYAYLLAALVLPHEGRGRPDWVNLIGFARVGGVGLVALGVVSAPDVRWERVLAGVTLAGGLASLAGVGRGWSRSLTAPAGAIAVATVGIGHVEIARADPTESGPRPDLLLLDVHMPDGGGLAVIRAIGGGSPGSHFLALSVSDAPEDVIELIRAGARG